VVTLTSNRPFSTKETASIIRVQPTKASQAMQPAWEKVAKHWRVSPERTLMAILQQLDALEPMSELEIELRTRMLSGRL